MDSRGTLLDCALRLFADRGYDAVGVQEIVEAAGVTKPTLYHHFGSKRGLLEALVDERLRPLTDSLREATRYQGDLPKTLGDIVDAYFAFGTRERTFYQLLLAMSFAPEHNQAYEVASPPLRFHLALIEQVFVDAVPGHGNLRNRQQALAVSFLGIINSYLALVWRGGRDSEPRLAHDVVKQFSYGIYA